MKMKQSKQFNKAKVIMRRNHNVVIRKNLLQSSISNMIHNKEPKKFRDPCIYVCTHVNVIICIFTPIYNSVEVVKPPNIS